ncbi:hypothetical protein GWI33_015219 [Rhynchophorus ferrugineus]|uniref:Uncharacterized protein n=1 Tax=Rhynchophorus ferrugineus TaxID=354439 RepID=A0A834I146_RHYFE|nr:hypothetical protein GWI33_015219 [Rhynchophorus ferrugineus]
MVLYRNFQTLKNVLFVEKVSITFYRADSLSGWLTEWQFPVSATLFLLRQALKQTAELRGSSPPSLPLARPSVPFSCERIIKVGVRRRAWSSEPVGYCFSCML